MTDHEITEVYTIDAGVEWYCSTCRQLVIPRAQEQPYEFAGFNEKGAVYIVRPPVLVEHA